MEEKLSISDMLARMKKEWPEIATDGTGAVLGLIRLNDILMDSSNKVLTQFGLTQAAFEVLTTLRSYPKPRRLTPTELYKSILITSGGMTKVLNQLESDGLIERLENAADKRSQFVNLTPSGEKMAERSMKAIMENDQKILGTSLSKSEIKTLKSLLLQVLNGLE